MPTNPTPEQLIAKLTRHWPNTWGQMVDSDQIAPKGDKGWVRVEDVRKLLRKELVR